MSTTHRSLIYFLRSSLCPLLMKNRILYHKPRWPSFTATIPSYLPLSGSSLAVRFVHSDASQQADAQTIINAVVKQVKDQDLNEDDLVEVPENVIQDMLKKVGIDATSQNIFDSRQKLLKLQRLGCSLETACSYPIILYLTLKEISHEVKRLERIEFEVVHPELICIAYKTERHLKVVANDWIYKTFGLTGKEEAVCVLLGITRDDISFILYKKKIKYQVRNVFISKIIHKIHFLFQNGFTAEDIKKNVQILNISLEALQERTRCYKEKFPSRIPVTKLFHPVKSGQLSLSDGVENEDFEEDSSTSERYYPFANCINNREIFAKLLKVDVRYLQNFDILNKLLRKNLIQKLTFLLQCGISMRDIVNHILILRYLSVKQMEKIADESRKAGFDNPTIHHFLNLSMNHRFPKYTKRVQCEKELANLLDVSLYDIQLMGLPNSWHADKIQMQINFQILLENGFDIEDIKACPLVLGHGENILKTYLPKLKDDENLKSFDTIRNDKGKMLNVLQYFIEKDYRFCGVVSEKI